MTGFWICLWNPLLIYKTCGNSRIRKKQTWNLNHRLTSTKKVHRSQRNLTVMTLKYDAILTFLCITRSGALWSSESATMCYNWKRIIYTIKITEIKSCFQNLFAIVLKILNQQNLVKHVISFWRNSDLNKNEWSLLLISFFNLPGQIFQLSN